ncbi:hypothetical protein HRbin24_01502 [bacterium HR24]|nr:hypothetical protein HRbin24_01502 [bacterium HR24]
MVVQGAQLCPLHHHSRPLWRPIPRLAGAEGEAASDRGRYCETARRPLSMFPGG